MKEDIINLFFNKKTLQIFLSIEEGYAAKIRNKVGCMYSYVTMRLEQFEKAGLATSRREGRTNRYTLTEKGKKLKSELEKLVSK
ncbi:MAG: winged helix-turn-helix transcriptional regulator [Methanomicrobia archaeon]|nr:winged helix-turn-helix transcriptional regulator [Methanomicrobia archaeon]MCK4310602.1 winged helix-turn-helix transcriptional regulator [Methanomicrobia archaeon]MCK4433656.1 winged helix-turn-helix transcriptional regulator [Methanomicrobia archaeon]